MTYSRPACSDEAQVYRFILQMADALLDDETDAVSATANLSALIYDLIPDLNWAGFYRARGDQLILGPFQGKPACTRIARGRGVCGTCFAEDSPLVISDVHAFSDHIACDSASRSELVIPIHCADGSVCGVLDLDSPHIGRFDQAVLEGLLALIEHLELWMERCHVDSL